MSGTPKIVLTYEEATLYESDVLFLANPQAWLNDSCIHFQMQRLQNQHNIISGTPRNNQQCVDTADAAFFDPAVISFLMHQCQDEEEFVELYEGRNLKSTSFLLLPINDNNSASYDSFQRPHGGHHWSLLCGFVQLDNSVVFMHFDSCRGLNAATALAVAKKFSELLNVGSKVRDNGVRSLTLGVCRDKIMVNECHSPQQHNAHDCGLFTLAAATALADANFVTSLTECSRERVVGQLLEGDIVQLCERKVNAFYSSYSGDLASQMRQSMLEDISELRKSASTHY